MPLGDETMTDLEDIGRLRSQTVYLLSAYVMLSHDLHFQRHLLLNIKHSQALETLFGLIFAKRFDKSAHISHNICK